MSRGGCPIPVSAALRKSYSQRMHNHPVTTVVVSFAAGFHIDRIDRNTIISHDDAYHVCLRENRARTRVKVTTRETRSATLGEANCL